MFVSTYESAIDVKGRVSIPAPFRAALGGGTRIFLWQALDGSG
ncbi:MAG: MraZ protein, partial [Hyphomonas sp.]